MDFYAAPKIPMSSPDIGDEEREAVLSVLNTKYLSMGPYIGQFEEAICKYTGAKHAIGVNSGTSGLHLCVRAAGIGPGDLVLTTPFSFVSSANVALFEQATPVFVDVEERTGNIDVEQLAEAAADLGAGGKRAQKWLPRKNTPENGKLKAIIPVDYTGQPCDLNEIKEIARKHGLIVIEDAAHALGATYQGRRIGSLSDMTIFSFHPVKLITTGEGGAVVTDEPELARRLRIFRNHGITTEAREREEAGDWFYEMVYLGYNYRLTDIQCALGLSQMNKLDSWLARRREIARRYDEAFTGLPEIMTPVVKDDRSSAWHLYVIRLNLERLQVGRTEVFAALRAENIGVNVHYIPVYWHPYYQGLGYKQGLCPIAEASYERLISLPIFPGMSDHDVEDVIKAVKKVCCRYRRC